MNHDSPEIEREWTFVHRPQESRETMTERIIRVKADERDLRTFHNISLTQPDHLMPYLHTELHSLTQGAESFSGYTQDERVDFLLLRNYLRRTMLYLEAQKARNKEMSPLLDPWADGLVVLLEARQSVRPGTLRAEKMAKAMTEAASSIEEQCSAVKKGELRVPAAPAARAGRVIEELRGHLHELDSFFRGYDPAYDHWTAEACKRLDAALHAYEGAVMRVLVGVTPEANPDEIVGDPIGRGPLLEELQAEMIPYTPEELLAAANRQFEYWQGEMKKAAAELGFTDEATWQKQVLEHTMARFEEPGEQIHLVRRLLDEGADYVKTHDLVTVPAMAERTWRMFMMTPEAQKVNPYFLGGEDIIVSYPTAGMSFQDKMMSLRGNNRHFSKVSFVRTPRTLLYMYTLKLPRTGTRSR